MRKPLDKTDPEFINYLFNFFTESFYGDYFLFSQRDRIVKKMFDAMWEEIHKIEEEIK